MLKYAVKSIKTKKIISVLFMVAICIATAISMLAINITLQIEEGFFSADKKYDVILGNNGSSTQLIMSSLFFSDDPLGTIDYDIYEDMLDDGFEKVVPISIADNYRNSRIIGSTKELLEGYNLVDGTLFNKEFDMVLGYEVAKAYGINIGDTIVSSHGVSGSSTSHENLPYIVVGILEKTNTNYDNVCFTSLESIWNAHSHSEEEEIALSLESMDEIEEDSHGHEEEHEHSHEEGEICAILIKTGSLTKLSSLETEYSNNSVLQIINTTSVLRKLMANIDLSKQVAYLLCTIILILSAILIIVMSFLMMLGLNKDVETLKFLGMKKSKTAVFIIGQGAILSLVGIGIGICLSRGFLVVANKVSTNLGIVLDISRFYKEEIIVLVLALVITIVPSIIYTILKLRKGEK